MIADALLEQALRDAAAWPDVPFNPVPVGASETCPDTSHGDVSVRMPGDWTLYWNAGWRLRFGGLLISQTRRIPTHIILDGQPYNRWSRHKGQKRAVMAEYRRRPPGGAA